MRRMLDELRKRLHEGLDDPMTTEEKLAEIRRRLSQCKEDRSGEPS